MASLVFAFFALGLLNFVEASVNSTAGPDYAVHFAFGNHSFLIRRNREICASFSSPVVPDPSITDFGVYLTGKAAELIASRPAGGALVLGKGVYPVSSAIILPSNVCLVGMGMFDTVIKVVDKANDVAPYRGVIRAVNASRITLANFSLNCNRANQVNRNANEHFAKFGVFIRSSNYSLISHVRVSGALGYGCTLHSPRFFSNIPLMPRF